MEMLEVSEEMSMKDWHEVPADSEVNACLLIVHGAGEHYGRHEEVANYFAKAGFYVGLGDLPGHGRARGMRGHIDDFQMYIDTVAAWAQKLKQPFPSVPRFILGHSMGGLITARFIQQQSSDEWNGVLLSSPCLGLALPVPGWKKSLAHVLERWWPTLRLKSGIDQDALCRDPQVVDGYQQDPLVVKKVSVKWFCELQRAMSLVHEAVDRFQAPVLVMQGGEDRVVDPAATRRWYDRLDVEDKQLIWVDDGYHELLQDFNKHDLMKKMLAWTEDRL